MKMTLALAPTDTPDLLRSAMTRTRRRPVRRLIRARFRKSDLHVPADERRRKAIAEWIQPTFPELNSKFFGIEGTRSAPRAAICDLRPADANRHGDIPHPPISAQNNYVAGELNWGRNQPRGARRAGAPIGNRNAALSPEAAAARAKLAEVKAQAAFAIARLKLLIAQAKMLARCRAVVVHDIVENGVLVRRTTVEYSADGTVSVQRFAFGKVTEVMPRGARTTELSHVAPVALPVIPGRPSEAAKQRRRGGEGDPGGYGTPLHKAKRKTEFVRSKSRGRPILDPLPLAASRSCGSRSAGDDNRNSVLTVNARRYVGSHISRAGRRRCRPCALPPEIAA